MINDYEKATKGINNKYVNLLKKDIKNLNHQIDDIKILANDESYINALNSLKPISPIENPLLKTNECLAEQQELLKKIIEIQMEESEINSNLSNKTLKFTKYTLYATITSIIVGFLTAIIIAYFFN